MAGPFTPRNLPDHLKQFRLAFFLRIFLPYFIKNTFIVGGQTDIVEYIRISIQESSDPVAGRNPPRLEYANMT